MDSINERIKSIRKSFKLSQEAMAKEFGLTQPAYSKIESGENKPSLAILEIMIKNYKINANWLIAGVGDIFETAALNGITGNNNQINIGAHIVASPNNPSYDNETNITEHRHLEELLASKDLQIAYLQGQVEMLRQLFENKKH